MKRSLAMAAVALVVLPALWLCFMGPGVTPPCCKGHCAMAATPAPVAAVAPLKTFMPALEVIAAVVEPARPAPVTTELGGERSRQRVDSITTVVLRI